MDIFNNAVILLDKPVDRTSFECIGEVRRLTGIRKVGHSGTLDKFASGLLVICTGQATKLTRYFLEGNKRYTGKIQYGVVTDTFDTEGEVIERNFSGDVKESDILALKNRYSGKMLQEPPVYSALKVNGRRASDLVRQGKEVKLDKREVKIFNLDIFDIDLKNSIFSIDVSCSKGTYIRSIARDMGNDLGTGAHLLSLRRIESGHFSVKQAVTLDELKAFIEGKEVSKEFIKKPAEALKNYGYIIVKNSAKEKIFNGVYFKEDDICEIVEKGDENQDNFYIILDEDKNLIAIAEVNIGIWQIKYQNVFNLI